MLVKILELVESNDFSPNAKLDHLVLHERHAEQATLNWKIPKTLAFRVRNRLILRDGFDLSGSSQNRCFRETSLLTSESSVSISP